MYIMKAAATLGLVSYALDVKPFSPCVEISPMACDIGNCLNN